MIVKFIFTDENENKLGNQRENLYIPFYIAMICIFFTWLICFLTMTNYRPTSIFFFTILVRVIRQLQVYNNYR